MTIGRRRGWLSVTAVAVAMAAAIGVMLYTKRAEPPFQRGRDAGVMRSVGVAPSAVEALPDPAPMPPPVGSSLSPPTGIDDAVRRALRMPADALLNDIIRGDAAARVTCGKVAATVSDLPRDFVYIRLADLGAVNDGSQAFAQMHERMCRRN